MKKSLLLMALLAIGIPCAAKIPVPAFKETPSGLKWVDMREGRGRSPEPGQTCAVLYRAWLHLGNRRGPLVESVQNRKRPFSFVLGSGKALPGLDEAVQTMKPGGKRALVLPPPLAYGDKGSGEQVPPGSTLLLEVELVSAR
jgi:peptidylprolyl isomerase